MPRLFLKLFGTFWLTTVLILSISIFASFRLADDRLSRQLIDPREMDALLGDVLDVSGLDGLRSFVADTRNFPPGQTVYVVNVEGRELLGRDVPIFLSGRLDRIWRMLERHERRQADGRPSRRGRSHVPVLTAADGSRWLAIPGPAPPPRFGILSGAGWLVFGLATMTSLATFWLLSRSLVGPARRIAAAVDRFATGDMSARVGREAYRKDEIGELARQFDRMAEALEAQAESRRELFRNVSHELRAPLARLQIAADLLDRNPRQAREQLARIRSEIHTLDELTGQVLALAQAAQVSAEPRAVLLADVLRRVRDSARDEARERDVALDWQEPAEPLTVQADENLLASAIENVVRNALQASAAGSRVAVSVTAAGAECVVEVVDQGPGVPDAELERIFEPFFRLDTNRPGSGIGLAITERVVARAGGRVSAVNAPGGGLRVSLVLPLAGR